MKAEREQEEIFVFASSKEWHRPFFDIAQKEMSGQWLWVSSPQELDSVIGKASPRYIFFVHWNWLVAQEIWERYECVCFHMTDVPYGRGGSPLQNLIMAGQTATKLSALRMVEEMDAGPVYAKKSFDLCGSAQEIYIKVGQLSVEIMKWMISTRPEPVPQQGDAVTFKRRKPEQSCIPKRGDIVSAYDFIRMLDADGYPHAFLEYGNYRIEFRKAHRDEDVLSAEVRITLKI